MSKFGELIDVEIPVLLDFYTEWDDQSEPMHLILRDVAAALGDKAKVIKIDVEGAEFEILKGANRTLTEIRPFWFVEISETKGRFNNNSKDTFKKFLDANYAAFYFNEQREWVAVHDYGGENDFLFVPKEMLNGLNI